MAALDPITAIGNIADDVLKSVLPDKQAEAAGKMAQLQAQVQVIVAEASSKFALAAVWRPITMLTFVAIIANNYILAPYLQALFGWHVTLDIPPQMWDLLKLGIGGYVVGRSAEKMMSTYAQSKAGSTAPAAFNTNGG